VERIHLNKWVILLITPTFLFTGCYFWRGSKIIIKRYPKKVIEVKNPSESVKDSELPANKDRLFINNTSVKNENQKREYTVGPEDVLSITVWENPDLSQEERVGEDGTISYPFIGRIHVAGKTVKEIAEMLTELVGKDLVYDPQIDVSIKEYKSKKVFVVGEVTKPGPYNLRESRTLFEILSDAGGIKKDTAGNYVIVKRKLAEGNEEYSEIKIPLYKGQLEKDIEIFDGDIIKIPEAKFFISGEVSRPGFFPITEDLNIFQAIIVAGGFTKAADKNNVKLSRNNGKEVLLVDVERMRKALERGILGSKEIEEQIEELKLRDGDMIFVPTSFFYSD